MKSKLIFLCLLFSFCFAVQAAAQSLPDTLGWYVAPNSKIESVCAATNGFPQVAGAESCFGILSWSGGIFDSRRNRMIVFGGGHNGYYGNELYSFSLETLRMERITDPGLPPATVCDEAIAAGTQPNSRHTYDGIEYMENVDRMFVYGGSLACGPGNFGRDTWTFDFTTSQWQRMNPSGPIPKANPGVVAAYDPVTGKIFLHDENYFFSYDFGTNTYERLSPFNIILGYHMVAAIDPVRREFVIVGYDSQYSGGRVWSIDISDSSNYEIREISTSGANALINSTYPGVDYDTRLQRIVAWNGGNSAYSLDLDTGQWTPHTFSGGPSNASASGRGTHGRWRYSATSGVYVLVNEFDQDTYVLRISESIGSGETPSAPANLRTN